MTVAPLAVWNCYLRMGMVVKLRTERQRVSRLGWLRRCGICAQLNSSATYSELQDAAPAARRNRVAMNNPSTPGLRQKESATEDVTAGIHLQGEIEGCRSNAQGAALCFTTIFDYASAHGVWGAARHDKDEDAHIHSGVDWKHVPMRVRLCPFSRWLQPFSGLHRRRRRTKNRRDTTA